jgi:hypothetical protein
VLAPALRSPDRRSAAAATTFEVRRCWRHQGVSTGALMIDPRPIAGASYAADAPGRENPSGRRPPAAAFLQMLALQPGARARFPAAVSAGRSRASTVA